MTLQEQIELIIGPQSANGDWFDTTLLSKARQHGEACPAIAPQKPESPVQPLEKDFATIDAYRTALKAWTEVPVIAAWIAALDAYILLNYYDLPSSEYTAHARSGEPAFLTLGDKCADAWWTHPTWIGEGRIRLWLPRPQGNEEASPPPRHAGIAGLIRRAEKRPEMWDWLNDYVSYFFHIYIGRRLTEPLYDVREGAFTLRYAAWLSQLLPDSFPTQAGGRTDGAQLRAAYLKAVESAAVDYFGRNQRADGAYVWNDNWPDDDGTLQGVMQPFIVGLLLQSLCVVHRVTTNPAVKENVKNQICNGCRHLYSNGPYIKDQIEQNSGKRIRGFHYFYHGGNTVNPTKYEQGDIRFPWTATEAWWLPSTRQAISTILGPFGYAYKISGDEFFKSAGNEMYDAAYLGTDGVRAMMDDTAKNFNQHVMGSSSYKAWVGGVVSPPPAPPAPAPTPTPEPSPDGTKATTIVDSSRATWTIGSARQTLRNGVQVGGGEGSIYKYLSQVVYVSGTDGFWYKWLGSAWERQTQTEPGTMPSPTPTPSPTPIPTPIPTPTPCTMMVSSPTIPAWGTGKLIVTLTGLTGPGEVKVTSNSGQITVTPNSKPVSPDTTSVIAEFQLQAKKKSGTVTVSGPCGTQTVTIPVR